MKFCVFFILFLTILGIAQACTYDLRCGNGPLSRLQRRIDNYIIKNCCERQEREQFIPVKIVPVEVVDENSKETCIPIVNEAPLTEIRDIKINNFIKPIAESRNGLIEKGRSPAVDGILGEFGVKVNSGI